MLNKLGILNTIQPNVLSEQWGYQKISIEPSIFHFFFGSTNKQVSLDTVCVCVCVGVGCARVRPCMYVCLCASETEKNESAGQKKSINYGNRRKSGERI